MTTTAEPVTFTDPALAERLAAGLVRFLETGTPPEGVFAPDLFTDFTMPLWRLQAGDLGGAVALRRAGHPCVGRVPRSRLDVTGTGFLLEVEEEWEQHGETWYCRELMRCDVAGGAISELSVYCTGDWDEATVARHAAAVTLIRP